MDCSKTKSCKLNLGGTTVDEELDAVDEAGIAGGEEESDRRDLLRASHLAAGYLGFEELLRVGSEGIEDRGVDRAGTEDVHADSTLLEFQEPGTGKRANRSLTGMVAAQRQKSIDARNGTVEKDRAVVVEGRERLLRSEECAADVETEEIARAHA